jgi:hypothetical protein
MEQVFLLNFIYFRKLFYWNSKRYFRNCTNKKVLYLSKISVTLKSFKKTVKVIKNHLFPVKSRQKLSWMIQQMVRRVYITENFVHFSTYKSICLDFYYFIYMYVHNHLLSGISFLFTSSVPDIRKKH